MRKIAIQACLTLAMLCGWTTRLGAESVVWKFSGIITDVEETKPFWDNSVTLGTPFEVISVFDTQASDANPSESLGYYSGASFRTTLKFGNYEFSHRTEFVGILNDRLLDAKPRDGYDWLSFGFAQSGLTNITMQGHLHSRDTTLLSNDSLHIQEFPVSLFDIQRNFELIGTFNDGSGNAYLNGNFSSYSVQTIPEPSVVGLIVIGGAVWIGLRVFRSQSRPPGSLSAHEIARGSN